MTTKPDIKHAPGCFGAALTYQPESVECRSCPFVSDCAPRSYERLVELRKRLGQKPPKPYKPLVESPNPVKHPTELAVPKKVEDLLGRIERRNIYVRDTLLRGVNPFASGKPQFLFVACELLLRSKTGVTKEILTEALIRKLHWTRESAAAHALQATQALRALGATIEENGRTKLKGL